LSRIQFPSLAAAALLLIPFSNVAPAQKKLTATPPAANASVEDRRKALNALINRFWDASLQVAPEFASAIGDKRWNDKISDYSVKAVNAWLEQEQNYMMRLGAIDPAGFTDSGRCR